jgi:hypothetical protein
MEPEIIEIGSNSGLKSTNFGSGIELLMNGKKKSGGNSDSIKLDDLDDLAEELNNLVDVDVDVKPLSFGLGDNDNEPLTVSFDELDSSKIPQAPTIGESTRNANENSKTWDGFGQFDDIPVTPNMTIPSGPKLSKEETIREKFNYLRKLEALEKKGIELTKKYSMDSNLAEMMGEYQMVVAEKERQNSIKFQGNMLSALINGVEFMNNRFDPFDIKLDGWGEQFSENLNDYDEIFAELHEKYSSTAQMAPEVKLIFQLAASGMMVHMTNTMFKSSMPNMDDILRQNPDLMSEFNKAAVNTMGNTNPGFSGFMGNVMNQGQQQPPPSNSGGMRMGPPPAAMATQEMPAPRRPGSMFNNEPKSNRPDVTSARNSGVSINNDFTSIEESTTSIRAPPQERKIARAEMKGPTDISDLLGGLKQASPPSMPMHSTSKSPVNTPFMNDKVKPITKEIKNVTIPKISDVASQDDAGSTISLNELKELQVDGTVPKRSRRRKGSEKNTISLDI